MHVCVHKLIYLSGLLSVYKFSRCLCGGFFSIKMSKTLFRSGCGFTLRFIVQSIVNGCLNFNLVVLTSTMINQGLAGNIRWKVEANWSILGKTLMVLGHSKLISFKKNHWQSVLWVFYYFYWQRKLLHNISCAIPSEQFHYFWWLNNKVILFSALCWPFKMLINDHSAWISFFLIVLIATDKIE